MFCKCTGKRKDYPLSGWRIVRYRYTPYHYSRVYCQNCKSIWITRAKYVEQVPQMYGQQNLFTNGKINR